MRVHPALEKGGKLSVQNTHLCSPLLSVQQIVFRPNTAKIKVTVVEIALSFFVEMNGSGIKMSGH